MSDGRNLLDPDSWTGEELIIIGIGNGSMRTETR